MVELDTNEYSPIAKHLHSRISTLEARKKEKMNIRWEYPIKSDIESALVMA